MKSTVIIGIVVILFVAIGIVLYFWNQTKYSCVEGSCVETEDGDYTSSNCDDECVAPTYNYSSSTNTCVESELGTLTKDECDDEIEYSIDPATNTCVKEINGDYQGLDACNDAKSSTGTYDPNLLMENTNYTGNDIWYADNVSVSGCYDVCQLDNNCKSFVFNHDMNRCHLKTNVATASQYTSDNRYDYYPGPIIRLQ